MKGFILTLILFVGLFAGCGGDGNTNTTPTDWDTFTPSGVRITSNQPVSSATQNLVDSSLTKLFSDARADGYGQVLSHKNYAIKIKNDCVDRNGTMSFKLRADNYDGTEYDQNPTPGIGEIFAAEQVEFTNGQPNGSYIICKDSEATMRNTVRYGAEHIILFYNDRGKYEQTKTHITGGHPVITMQ